MYFTIKLGFEVPHFVRKHPVACAGHEALASLYIRVARCIASARDAAVVGDAESRLGFSKIHTGGVHAETAVDHVDLVIAARILFARAVDELCFADIFVDSTYFVDKIG